MKRCKCLEKWSVLLFCGIWVSFNAYIFIQKSGEGKYFRKAAEEATVITERSLESFQENVLKNLKADFLHKPSVLPYNLSTDPLYIAVKNGYSWSFLNYFVELLFQNKTFGTFIEAGALDGEFLSITLRLEKDLNWRGLLIEPDPYNYKELLTKNRKAWTSNSCISDVAYPKVVTFVSVDNKTSSSNISYWVYRGSSHVQGVSLSHNFENFFKSIKTNLVKSQCFSLYSHILALNMTVIDLISLNILGSELKVLQTLPFDKIRVKVFIVNLDFSPNFKFRVDKFFGEKGYQLIACDDDNNYIYILKEEFKSFEFPTVNKCGVTIKKQ